MIGFERNDEKGITGILSGSHSHQASYAILFFTAVRARGFLMKSQETADETASFFCKRGLDCYGF
jgi:hypothetical protein